MLKHAKVEYTDRWNDFQIVAPTYEDGHFEPDQFNIVKWMKHESPVQVLDTQTNENKMQSEHCFVIASLIWNHRQCDFEFKSVGLRYFDHYIEGLNGWIMEFCQAKRYDYLSEEDK